MYSESVLLYVGKKLVFTVDLERTHSISSPPQSPRHELRLQRGNVPDFYAFVDVYK